MLNQRSWSRIRRVTAGAATGSSAASLAGEPAVIAGAYSDGASASTCCSAAGMARAFTGAGFWLVVPGYSLAIQPDPPPACTGTTPTWRRQEHIVLMGNALWLLGDRPQIGAMDGRLLNSCACYDHSPAPDLQLIPLRYLAQRRRSPR